MSNQTQVKMESWQDTARRTAQSIRLRVLDHVLKNNGGYMSQACSSAELLSVLYTRVMNLGPSISPMIPPPFSGVPSKDNPNSFTGAGYNGPKAPHLDRFIFSPAHYALVLYSILIETGRMSPEGLEQFNQDGSTVEMIGAEHSPGCEVTSGSLAQALSQAAGIALARRMRGETGWVWVFLSDGELQEGQTWETLATLSAYRLDNVGIYVDVNGQQCDGTMQEVMNMEPLASKLEAFGARVFEVDGHDVDALAAPAALAPDGRPLVVLARTDACRGLDVMRARAPKFHYLRFTSEEERQSYQKVYQQMCANTEE